MIGRGSLKQKKHMQLWLLLITLFLLSTPMMRSQELLSDVFKGKHTLHHIMMGKDSITVHHYVVENRKSIIFGLELVYLKIPRSKVSLKIKDIGKKGDADSIYDQAASPNSLLLASGGFWGYDTGNKKIPLGLVVSEGKVLNKKSRWTTGGVLYQNNKTINIKHISKFSESSVQEAIQSKPILVQQGKNDIYSDSRKYFDRIAIGLTMSNEILVCGVFNSKGRGISLYEFAEILVKKEHTHYPNTRIALAMDGGPSSHLYFPPLKKHMGYSHINHVPNLINFIYNE